MQYAMLNEIRVGAYPNASEAKCPICESGVIAKCGKINIWHWAHKSISNCDSWKESETLWHREWKECFDEQYREVSKANHRADILLPNGLAIEFQHSPISPDEIRAREAFWGKMIWVFDARKYNLDFSERTDGGVNWRRGKKTILTCKRPILFDIGGNKLLNIVSIYKGWGRRVCYFKGFSKCNFISSTITSPHYFSYVKLKGFTNA